MEKQYKPWWEKPDLYEAELIKLASIGFSRDETHNEPYDIAFQGQVNVLGEDYDLILVYPCTFPKMRPEMFCNQYPPSTIVPHLLASNGTLCLLDYDPDEWDPNIHDCIFLLKRAKIWLENQKTVWLNGPGEEAPEPRQYNDETDSTMIIPSEYLEDLTDKKNHWKFGKCTLLTTRDFKRCVLVGLAGKSTLSEILKTKIPTEVYVGNRHIEVDGFWFMAIQPPPIIKTFLDYVKFAESQGIEQADKKIHDTIGNNATGKGVLLGIFFIENGRPTWMFGCFSSRKFKREDEIRYKTYNITTENIFRRVNELRILNSKRVMMIGLGCLGSPAALEMARAGVQNFLFIDPDRVDVGNVVRQEYNLRDVGKFKVNALLDRIVNTNPFVNITRFPTRVGHEPDILIEMIEKYNPDLIMVAIGRPSAERVINEISVMMEKPVIYTSTTAGAWGGIVFRYIPKETGCYDCVGWHRSTDPTWETAPAAPDIKPTYDDGCMYPAFPGVGVDTRTISLMAARLCIQTLLRNEPKEIYPDSDCHLIMYANRGTEGYETMVAKKKNYGQHQNCRVCGPSVDYT